MREFFFEYKINPISVNHYWDIKCINNRPIVYKKKEGKEFKEIIRWKTLSQCKKQKIKLDFPLFPKPSKLFLKIEYFYLKKPKDIDNILKALLDSLEGILFENDAQIYELHIIKKHSHTNQDFLKIYIKEIDENVYKKK